MGATWDRLVQLAILVVGVIYTVGQYHVWTAHHESVPEFQSAILPILFVAGLALYGFFQWKTVQERVGQPVGDQPAVKPHPVTRTILLFGGKRIHEQEAVIREQEETIKTLRASITKRDQDYAALAGRADGVGIELNRLKQELQRARVWTDLTFSQMEHVRDRQFVNETVVLDGRAFQRCAFIGCQLIFNGTKSFVTEHCTFAARVSLKTTDPASATWIRYLQGMLDAFGMIGRGMLVLDTNTNIIVVPPQPGDSNQVTFEKPWPSSQEG